jgi:gamma-glutamyltranspeptidase/glutathione hydrolase
LAERLKAREDCLNEFEATRKIFFGEGKIAGEGEKLIQRDLARTLRRISQKGPDDFYEGEIARKIDAEMRKGKGLIRREDLKDYRVKTRVPLQVSYRGYDLYLMPLPSSGGILMAEMFQMLSEDPLGNLPWGTWKEAHLLAEAMKLAFYDRSRFLGDGDFVKVPQDRLLSLAYAKEQRRKISFQKRIRDLAPETGAMEGGHTTHATFADREGNIVSMTNTLNLSFGSCAVVPGTGILLNNEMDDFETHPGKPNAFDLIQGELNVVGPGKRPLSSMSPTLVFKGGKPLYALGSPGGPMIISNIFQVLINLLDHQTSLEEAIVRPKIHHQYLPDVIRYEKGYPNTTLRGLQKLGHSLEPSEKWGNVEAIQMDWSSGMILGVADSRGEGVAGILLSK